MGKLRQIHEAITSKAIGCEELIRSVLNTISSENSKYNAFIEPFEDRAIRIAKEQDELLSKGKTLPIGAGIPVGIKDNMCLEGEGLRVLPIF